MGSLCVLAGLKMFKVFTNAVMEGKHEVHGLL